MGAATPVVAVADHHAGDSGEGTNHHLVGHVPRRRGSWDRRAVGVELRLDYRQRISQPPATWESAARSSNPTVTERLRQNCKPLLLNGLSVLLQATSRSRANSEP